MVWVKFANHSMKMNLLYLETKHQRWSVLAYTVYPVEVVEMNRCG